MSLEQRALVHAALGDPSRLRLIELLGEGDLTVQELGMVLQVPGNLLAHHLQVLETAGLIERRVSEADRRRRYVVLQRPALELLALPTLAVILPVLFVCRHNSARSQYAAAYWTSRTGHPAQSAGSEPAARVHPMAIRVAEERHIDLTAAVPRGYSSLRGTPDVVISVCDRARESAPPAARRQVHWSIPDPVISGRIAAFRRAFAEIEQRVDYLAGAPTIDNQIAKEP